MAEKGQIKIEDGNHIIYSGEMVTMTREYYQEMLDGVLALQEENERLQREIADSKKKENKKEKTIEKQLSESRVDRVYQNWCRHIESVSLSYVVWRKYQELEEKGLSKQEIEKELVGQEVEIKFNLVKGKHRSRKKTRKITRYVIETMLKWVANDFEQLDWKEYEERYRK